MKIKLILVFVLATASIFLIWPTYENDLDYGCHDLIDPGFAINSDCEAPHEVSLPGGGLRFIGTLVTGNTPFPGANSFELFWINDVEYFTPTTALIFSSLAGAMAAVIFFTLPRVINQKDKTQPPKKVKYPK